MSLDETKFSHITVTPDDEDEFVIQAGTRTGSPSCDVAPEPSAVPDEALAHEAPEPEVPAPASDEPAPRASSDDKYHQTTLEDLETTPMSTTQKVVIAAAVLLIAGFVAYYLFLR